jgi:hypothetical protein
VRTLLRTGVALVALYVIAGLVWRYSGSNQWELAGERNGVRVYTLKEPGVDLLQFKGVVRVRSTLARLVAMLQDPGFSNSMGLKDTRVLERVDDHLQYDYFRANLPFPLKAREFVVRTTSYQNPHTRQVLMDITSVPDKIPPNDCCFRVTSMANRVRLTPLDNGEIEVEYAQNVNEGGVLPPLLLNLVGPRAMLVALPKLQGFLDREEHRDAKLTFIKER